MKKAIKKYKRKQKSVKEGEKDDRRKRVEDSRVETVHIIRPNHLNAAGRLFGGDVNAVA